MRKLLISPERWVRLAYFGHRSHGKLQSASAYFYLSVNCFCVLGALKLANAAPTVEKEILNMIRGFIPKEMDISEWNDHEKTTFKDVRHLLNELKEKVS